MADGLARLVISVVIRLGMQSKINRVFPADAIVFGEAFKPQCTPLAEPLFGGIGNAELGVDFKIPNVGVQHAPHGGDLLKLVQLFFTEAQGLSQHIHGALMASSIGCDELVRVAIRKQLEEIRPLAQHAVKEIITVGEGHVDLQRPRVGIKEPTFNALDRQGARLELLSKGVIEDALVGELERRIHRFIDQLPAFLTAQLFVFACLLQAHFSKLLFKISSMALNSCQGNRLFYLLTDSARMIWMCP